MSVRVPSETLSISSVKEFEDELKATQKLAKEAGCKEDIADIIKEVRARRLS